MCGMLRPAQKLASIVIARGGDIKAVDTYGNRRLHRMASNDLTAGARALLRAGADASARTWSGETANDVAASSGARVSAPALGAPSPDLVHVESVRL